MAGTDRRKQNLYFSNSMVDEIRVVAARLDRSLSWVVQKAWKVARDRVVATPSANAAPEARTVRKLVPEILARKQDDERLETPGLSWQLLGGPCFHRPFSS